MRHRRKETVEKNKSISLHLPFPRLLWFGSLVLVVLLGVNIYFANLLATSGVRMTASTQKVQKLEKEKEDLENKISELGSVSKIENKAARLGFVLPDSVEVLSSPTPVAERP